MYRAQQALSSRDKLPRTCGREVERASSTPCPSLASECIGTVQSWIVDLREVRVVTCVTPGSGASSPGSTQSVERDMPFCCCLLVVKPPNTPQRCARGSNKRRTLTFPVMIGWDSPTLGDVQ